MKAMENNSGNFCDFYCLQDILYEVRNVVQLLVLSDRQTYFFLLNLRMTGICSRDWDNCNIRGYCF